MNKNLKTRKMYFRINGKAKRYIKSNSFIKVCKVNESRRNSLLSKKERGVFSVNNLEEQILLKKELAKFNKNSIGFIPKQEFMERTTFIQITGSIIIHYSICNIKTATFPETGINRLSFGCGHYSPLYFYIDKVEYNINHQPNTDNQEYKFCYKWISLKDKESNEPNIQVIKEKYVHCTFNNWLIYIPKYHINVKWKD